MSVDVLVLTVPINGAYASMNSLDRIDRRKSPAYLDLFRDTREIARVEMERAGWTTREYYVATEVIRYTRDMRAFNGDASNLGKCELDSVSPSTPKQEARDRCHSFAGVWTNDRFARPYSATIEYDPEGEERVVVILRRRFPDPGSAKDRKRTPRAAVAAAKQIVVEASAVPARIRTLDEIRSGETVSFEERDRILAQAMKPKSEDIGKRPR